MREPPGHNGAKRRPNHMRRFRPSDTERDLVFGDLIF